MDEAWIDAATDKGENEGRHYQAGRHEDAGDGRPSTQAAAEQVRAEGGNRGGGGAVRVWRGVRHPVLTAMKVLISDTNPNAERSRILTRKDWKLKLMVTVVPACGGGGQGGRRAGEPRIRAVLCRSSEQQGWRRSGG